MVDEHLEGAMAVAMVELGAGRVEAVRILVAGDIEDIVAGDVEDLGVGIDEPADQPRAGDAVGLGTGTGDPLHVSSSERGSGCRKLAMLR